MGWPSQYKSLDKMPSDVAEGFVYLLRKHDERQAATETDPALKAAQEAVMMRLRAASGMNPYGP